MLDKLCMDDFNVADSGVFADCLAAVDSSATRISTLDKPICIARFSTSCWSILTNVVFVLDKYLTMASQISPSTRIAASLFNDGATSATSSSLLLFLLVVERVRGKR